MARPTTSLAAGLLSSSSRAPRTGVCLQCRCRSALAPTPATSSASRGDASALQLNKRAPQRSIRLAPARASFSSTSIAAASSASPRPTTTAAAADPTITLEIDQNVAVRLAKIKMRNHRRLLFEQAASGSNDAGPSSLSLPAAHDGTGAAGIYGADVLGKQLKELEPIREVWNRFEQKRTHLVSTIRMSQSDPDQDMRGMALEEIPALESELDELRAELEEVLLSSSHDPIEATAEGAILELRPGVGGQESSLFTAEMTRMYTKFCENKPADEQGDWQAELLSVTSTDVSTTSSGANAGLKEAIIEVKGKGAYRRLQYEAGVHRVQRIPTTQSLGKLQSSTIAVMVLPVHSSGAGEATKADDVVDPKDVKTEVMRSRGAGGQHVNKTESAIRLTHEPTGITVSMQDSRSQHQNRTKAWAVLRARLLDRKMREEVEGNRAKRLAQVAGMDRSDRIRTYNFPQDRVTDHRINLSVNGIDSIMEGEHEIGLGLEHMISELEAESKRRKLSVLLEMAESDEQQASGGAAVGNGEGRGKGGGRKK